MDKIILCIFRFLATGESYKSLSAQYRVGHSTIAKFVPEVCEAIWSTMLEHFMPFPKTNEDWQAKALSFAEKWDYPHCLGAIDGKHVVIEAPANSGSFFYNYKNRFSLVLMALVDADYKFTYVDIGAYGKQSDGGIFGASSLGRALSSSNNALQLPEDDVITGAEELGSLPYVFVADEAFPLQRHIMRPYPGRNTRKGEDVFNYRLSRARRVVENAFGILAEKWRVFHTVIAAIPENAVKIVQAAVMLHNFLQRQSNVSATQPMDDQSIESVDGLNRMPKIGNRGTDEAIQIRAKFASYFNAYPIPWQDQHVTRGLNK